MRYNDDPDAGIVATFCNATRPNPAKSALEGRPIEDDYEACDLHYSGRKDWCRYPATSFSRWVIDPETGEQLPQTYAERFARQYQQFKAKDQQTKAGTPLDYVTFLTNARKAEMRALHIYTVEALAEIDGQPLKNLGPHGRDYKNAAVDYLEKAKLSAPDMQLKAELDALRARNEVLENDARIIKAKEQAIERVDTTYDEMTNEQIRDLVASSTGHAPQGALGRKTLIRMANEAQTR